MSARLEPAEGIFTPRSSPSDARREPRTPVPRRKKRLTIKQLLTTFTLSQLVPSPPSTPARGSVTSPNRTIGSVEIGAGRGRRVVLLLSLAGNPFVNNGDRKIGLWDGGGGDFEGGGGYVSGEREVSSLDSRLEGKGAILLSVDGAREPLREATRNSKRHRVLGSTLAPRAVHPTNYFASKKKSFQQFNHK